MGKASRIVALQHGTIGLVEARQIVVTDVRSSNQLAEIGFAEGSEVASVGQALVVLAPTGQLYIVDPSGPNQIGELALDPGSRILAVSGDHVLVALDSGVAVVNTLDGGSVWPLPIRNAIFAAGPGIANHFIITNGGVLEEWSAVSRTPLRRFRLTKPIATRHVGGTARHVWFVSEGEPDQLVAIPVDGVTPPIHTALSEPAAQVIVHPSGRVVIVGATTRCAWTGRLGDRLLSATHAGPVDDLAWCDAQTLICMRESMLEIVELTGTNRIAKPVRAVVEQRLVASNTDWRDVVIEWSQRPQVTRGVPPNLGEVPLEALATRLGIDEHDRGFLWLLYAARLCGRNGVAPSELADATPRRWDEALGRGRLAATGAFEWRGNRVHLVPEVAAMLDESAVDNVQVAA